MAVTPISLRSTGRALASLVAFTLGCSACGRLADEPPRPANVPGQAKLIGGVDEWSWSLCSRAQSSVIRCRIWNHDGTEQYAVTLIPCPDITEIDSIDAEAATARIALRRIRPDEIIATRSHAPLSEATRTALVDSFREYGVNLDCTPVRQGRGPLS